MKTTCKTLATTRTILQLFTIHSCLFPASAAGVPTEWVVRIGPRSAAYQAERRHGDALALKASLVYNGQPLAYSGTARLYAQTNGMGATWWDLAPATVNSNVLEAVWQPTFDTGADVVDLFLGGPSNYQAAARIRFLPSPGAVPNSLPLPVPVLDFATVIVTNAPFTTFDDLATATNEVLQAALRAAPSKISDGTNEIDAARNVYKVYADAWKTADGSNIYTNRAGSLVWASIYQVDSEGSLVPAGSVEWAEDAMSYEGGEGPGWYLSTVYNYTPAYVYPGESDATILGGGALVRGDWAVLVGRLTTDDEVTAQITESISTLEEMGTVRGARALIGEGIVEDVTAEDVYQIKQAVTNLQVESALVYRLYSGSNVVAEVTNYNSSVHAPELRLMQLNESNEYITVWTETNGLARTLRASTNYADRAIADRAAPRAWSRTTSGLGAEAPSNTTWVSTPRTVIAGGLEYAKVVDVYGEVWVLSSNGMAAEFNLDTNAYFRISSDDGTPIFSIEKSDSQVVGADADGIEVGENYVSIPLSVVSADQPTLYWRQSLESGSWADESTPPTGATVSWSGTPGAYVCMIEWSGTRPSSMFFKFTFTMEGVVVIRNNATTDISSGIYVNGVKFVPSVSGNNLIWVKQ